MFNFFSVKFFLIAAFVVVVVLYFVNKDKEKHGFVGLNPLIPPDIPSNYIRQAQVEEFDTDKALFATPIGLKIPHTNQIGYTESEYAESEYTESEYTISECSDSDYTLMTPRPNLDFLNGSSVGEKLTCEAFKVIIGESNITHNFRPSFLRNPETGRNMEIDCWSESFGIGVEYNGLQHYSHPGPGKLGAFGMTFEKFQKQLLRDSLKRDLADNNGTPIITVPCTIDSFRFDRVKKKFVQENRTREERYDLIYKYLKQELAPFFKNKN